MVFLILFFPLDFLFSISFISFNFYYFFSSVYLDLICPTFSHVIRWKLRWLIFKSSWFSNYEFSAINFPLSTVFAVLVFWGQFPMCRELGEVAFPHMNKQFLYTSKVSEKCQLNSDTMYLEIASDSTGWELSLTRPYPPLPPYTHFWHHLQAEIITYASDQL